jgi:hypothetical protein
MNSQNPNSSFPLFPSVWNPPSEIKIQNSKFKNVMNSITPILQHSITPILPSTTPTHFWRIEPAPHVDPALAKRSPWYSIQHVFCRRDTGEIVGIVRRLKGQFKTAWFSGNSVTVKRHFSMQAAKKFLERQFTRTVPSGSVWKTEHAHVAPQHPPCSVLTLQRFNILTLPTAPRPCTGAQVIHVDFAAPRSSKFISRIRAHSRNSRITDH